MRLFKHIKKNSIKNINLYKIENWNYEIKEYIKALLFEKWSNLLLLLFSV